jgi:hypothetical protein
MSAFGGKADIGRYFAVPMRKIRSVVTMFNEGGLFEKIC